MATKTVGPDSVVHFDDGALDSAVAITAIIGTKQGKSEKNMWNGADPITSSQGVLSNGITCDWPKGKDVTISYSTESEYTRTDVWCMFQIKSGEIGSMLIPSPTGSARTRFYVPFTTNDDIKKFGFYVRLGNDVISVSDIMIEDGTHTDSEYVAYSEPFIKYTSIPVYVSPTSSMIDGGAHEIPIAESENFYAGEISVTAAGKVTLKKRPYYSSYNGETLVGPWVSSMEQYKQGESPTVGAEVVDLGGTFASSTFDATPITIYDGTNYIMTGLGDVMATYTEKTVIPEYSPIYFTPEGFHAWGESPVSYLDSNDSLRMNVIAPCIMINDESKLEILTQYKECVPGTIAYIGGWSAAWQYTVAGDWEKFI